MELVKKLELEIEENNLNTPFQNATTQPSSAATAAREPSGRERTYTDVPGLRHETKDVLQQLQANINCLEDLGGRLGFSLTEVRSLIRR